MRLPQKEQSTPPTQVLRIQNAIEKQIQVGNTLQEASA
jgi:hypothetical protein